MNTKCCHIVFLVLFFCFFYFMLMVIEFVLKAALVHMNYDFIRYKITQFCPLFVLLTKKKQSDNTVTLIMNNLLGFWGQVHRNP